MKTFSNPNDYARHIKEKTHLLTQDLRQNIELYDDPKFQALAETTAEVLQGLESAFEHYAEKSETAWK